MKSDRSLYLTDNKSIADNLVTLYRFNTPVDINLHDACYDQNFGTYKNNGIYFNFTEKTQFPYNFTLVQHNTVTMNSYFTSANNKIRIRDNYLYDNVLYPDISNDIFNQINQNIDRNVINMTISIPQIQNRIMYNFNPTIDFQNIYGDYRLKNSPSLLPRLLQAQYNDIQRYKSAINIQNSVIQYQKYFNKTIFKQIYKVIPSRCILNKGIVYGNSSTVAKNIINGNNTITVVNNNIISNVLQTIKVITGQLPKLNSTYIIQYNVNNHLPSINCDILQNSNIYIYNSTVPITTISGQFIQTVNTHQVHSSQDQDTIVKYMVNYHKLVVNDPISNKITNINIQ